MGRSKSVTNTLPSKIQLKSEEHRLIQAGLADNTRKAYYSGRAKFNEFQQSQNLQEVWPVPVDHLRQFISFLLIKGFSQSTASNYIAGIAYD